MTMFDDRCAVATGSNGVGKIISSKSSDGVPVVMSGLALTIVGEIVSSFVAKCDSKCTEDTAGCACCEETFDSHHCVVITCEVTD